MLDYWNSKDKILKFKNKTDFFKSEKFLLSLIKNKFRSVIDVGCASGMTAKLISESTIDLDYIGIDIAPKNIESAKLSINNFDLKSSKFLVGDIFEIKNKINKAELVYANGFMQHQLDFHECLNTFIKLSSKYIIFDFKIIKNHNTSKHLSYIKLNNGNIKIPFVAFSEDEYKKEISSFKNIEILSCIAYKTGIYKEIKNSNLNDIYSAGILLQVRNEFNNNELKIEWI